MPDASTFPQPDLSTWIRVTGRIVPGHKIASGQALNGPYPAGSLAMQKPFFHRLGLDLDGFYEGTLNISIAPLVFALAHPRFTFPLVAWTTLHPPETFSFSPCAVRFGGQTYAGWVYYPHPETKKAHFQDPAMIEIISAFISGIQEGDTIEVFLDPREIDLSKK